MKKSRGAHICSAKTFSRSKISADLSNDEKEDIIKAAWDDELERHLVHAFIAVADETPNAMCILVIYASNVYFGYLCIK